jgi:hypothetical protein
VGTPIVKNGHVTFAFFRLVRLFGRGVHTYMPMSTGRPTIRQALARAKVRQAWRMSLIVIVIVRHAITTILCR